MVAWLRRWYGFASLFLGIVWRPFEDGYISIRQAWDVAAILYMGSRPRNRMRPKGEW
jgi:hypothetical protein